MKSARTAFASLTAIAILATVSGPAYGNDHSNSFGSQEATQSSNEASETLGPDLEFSMYLADLLDTEPEAIVDHAWEGDHGVLVVLPEHYDRLTASTQDAPIHIEVSASASGAVPFTQQSDVESQILDAIDTTGLDAAAARYDYLEDRVEVSLWGAEDLEEFSETSDSHTFDDGTARDVTFTQRDDDAPQLESFRGGGQYNNCTGGFTGWYGSSVGIFTAAHCSTATTYEGFSVQNRYDASGNLDLQISTLDATTVFNSIYVGASATRSITGIGSLSSGISVEQYGQTSGYNETTVSHLEGCVEFSSGDTWCELWRTSDYVTDGGDSGGPWFSGNTALGTHTGGSSAGSLITPVQGLNSYFSSDAGISIGSE